MLNLKRLHDYIYSSTLISWAILTVVFTSIALLLFSASGCRAFQSFMPVEDQEQFILDLPNHATNVAPFVPVVGEFLPLVALVITNGFTLFKAIQNKKAAKSIVNATDLVRIKNPETAAVMSSMKDELHAALTPTAKVIIEAERLT